MVEFKDLTTKGTYLIMVRGSGFMAKGIQFFMRLYALRFNRKWRKPYNHSDIMCHGRVTGAKKEGIVVKDWREYYENRSLEVEVYEIISNNSIAKIHKIFKKYQGTPYDFKNFIDFIWKFFTKEWRGRTHNRAKKRLYCIEHSSLILEDLGVAGTLYRFWDNDPEELREWAENSLEFVGTFKI